MKIALVHAFFGGKVGGGGGIRQMTELGRGLKALGHEVVICAHSYEPGTIQPDPADEFEIRAVETGPIHIPETRRESLRFAWRQMREVAELVPSDVDAVNAHEAPAHMAGLQIAKRQIAPVVWTRNDHTLWETALMPDQTWVPAPGFVGRMIRLGLGLPDRRAGRAMDAIVVLDSRNRRMVAQAYKRDARIIQSGAAEKFFSAPARAQARAALGFAEGDFAVLGLGILAPYRRFEDLLLAIAQTPKSLAVKAHVIGSDHSFPDTAAALRALVTEHALEDRVELITDPIDDGALVNHYAAADVFVFPNEMQTWGLAPLEAIASGTPAIVSRGAGVHEVLEGRPGVQLVDPRSPDQIAAAIAEVAADPAAFNVSKTRDWIRGEFGNRHFAERMAALFDELRARA